MHEISHETSKPPILQILLVLFLAIVLNGWQASATQAKTDLDLLQGSWQGQGPGGPCTVEIEGNSLVYRQPQTDPSDPQFWYRTEFTLPDASGPKQLHATILEYSYENKQDVGTVVVTIFEVDAGVDGGTLRMGIVESFKELPEEPIVGDWEWVMDLYELERVAE